MTLASKIKWILSLLLIFFLVLATNLIDKRNFEKIKSSIVTIYEDRVVANDLIFAYLQIIHEKEMALTRSDAAFFTKKNKQLNTELQALTKTYKTTKLTETETRTFAMFQEDLSKLLALEASLNLREENTAYQRLLNNIKQDLSRLSKIQLEEGRNQVAISKNTFEEVEAFTKIEHYFLIALAVMVPVIIFGTGKSS